MAARTPDDIWEMVRDGEVVHLYVLNGDGSVMTCPGKLVFELVNPLDIYDASSKLCFVPDGVGHRMPFDIVKGLSLQEGEPFRGHMVWLRERDDRRAVESIAKGLVGRASDLLGTLGGLLSRVRLLRESLTETGSDVVYTFERHHSEGSIPMEGRTSDTGTGER